MEYTKGPWEVAHYTDGLLEGTNFIRNKNDASICTIVSTIDVAEANAHLIAASPQMYEALNALVRAYNNMSVPELCKQHELWQAAENALLKAEGKEAE